MGGDPVQDAAEEAVWTRGVGRIGRAVARAGDLDAEGGETALDVLGRAVGVVGAVGVEAADEEEDGVAGAGFEGGGEAEVGGDIGVELDWGGGMGMWDEHLGVGRLEEGTAGEVGGFAQGPGLVAHRGAGDGEASDAVEGRGAEVEG